MNHSNSELQAKQWGKTTHNVNRFPSGSQTTYLNSFLDLEGTRHMWSTAQGTQIDD